MLENSVILIHGYSLLASDQLSPKKAETGNRSWEHVVWGDTEKQLMGRVPYGILQALRQRPQLLVLGSGATCIHNGEPITRSKWEMLRRPKQVKWEADFTFETLQIKFHELIQFDLVNEAVINFGGVNAASSFINSIATTDVESGNSRDELFNALNKCKNNKINTLFSVSNPSHAPRCLDIALNEMKRMGYKGTLIPTPCEINFSEGGEVLIFEPQSGPGPKQEVTPCKVLKNYFKLSEDDKLIFLKECQSFFTIKGITD